MATLDPDAISTLLHSYLRQAQAPANLAEQMSVYLDLLVKWNNHTNLTAIREPEEIVRRHFGESLFLGSHLPLSSKTLLDFGSGAGFPGLPIQLLRPELAVTLAESQGKKASFLREVIRTLNLRTEVWAGRVEAMPEERRFDVVTMRAVDKMDKAKKVAELRVCAGGLLGVFATGGEGVPVPCTENSVLQFVRF